MKNQKSKKPIYVVTIVKNICNYLINNASHSDRHHRQKGSLILDFSATGFCRGNLEIVS